MDKELVNELTEEFTDGIESCIGQENIVDLEIEINGEDAQRGANSVSYVVGAISALMAVGLGSNEALDYIINRENQKYNMKLQKINNKNNLKIAKTSAIKIEQMEI